ncbi:hypothetical protein QA641_09360 [Bradyrhizobium sp. CB1650]|uniref:hypothetical protein n=1 Tax=Bradyrhizobium sp. CB1650 TaxID=3039153 RepID=UPI002434E2FD|nr:hypothetical protein [Bradyrhizobium sp. CB1650]WGD54087.1 hypothetical protein QA641_09360 [Bradyrhizobium sp. CB1650]
MDFDFLEIYLDFSAASFMFLFCSIPPEGRIAIVTKRGMECDGRDGVGCELRCRAGIP